MTLCSEPLDDVFISIADYVDLSELVHMSDLKFFEQNDTRFFACRSVQTPTM